MECTEDGDVKEKWRKRERASWANDFGFDYGGRELGIR